MRAVIRGWAAPAFSAPMAYVADRSPFTVAGIAGRGRQEFEVRGQDDVAVLAADLWTGSAARAKLFELAEGVADLTESAGAQTDWCEQD
jgi:hypothetical protein